MAVAAYTHFHSTVIRFHNCGESRHDGRNHANGESHVYTVSKLRLDVSSHVATVCCVYLMVLCLKHTQKRMKLCEKIFSCKNLLHVGMEL